MTKRTLYLLVTCCMEDSRFEILNKVIRSLKEEERNKEFFIEDDLIVFDNASTYPGSIDLLRTNFSKMIFVAKENLGYWSAINWVLERFVAAKYEYIYIIESDHHHFALERIEQCERALDLHPELGSVRTQEYSVKEQRLYNKTLQLPEGRRYAWVSHINSATCESVVLTPLNDVEDVYDSNFLTCLHSLNRIPTLQSVFCRLKERGRFSEHDFQRMYHDHYPRIGQLDGGIFHARLGFTLENPRSLSGSWSGEAAVTNHGYKETRIDRILQYDVVDRVI